MHPPNATVLYDGECRFCKRAISMIERHDQAGRFRCLPLDSAEAAPLLAAAGGDCETLHLFDDAGHHERSTAVLRIARDLGPPWSLLWWLRFVPRRLRDAAYGAVARRRRCIPLRDPQA
ncbi:MAG: DCC1-like thiol-disulfide oxidoreductase family protein [bacterium]